MLGWALLVAAGAGLAAAEEQPRVTVEVVHESCATMGDSWPMKRSGLSLGTDGALYGTTSEVTIDVLGTVYRWDPLTSTYTTLHVFRGEDGWNPIGVIQASDGALYGTTQTSGVPDSDIVGFGVLYRVNTDGTGFSVLYRFGMTPGEVDSGILPSGGLLQGRDGALYGTTERGGDGGGGTIFRVGKDGGNFEVVHAFERGSVEGDAPEGTLVQGDDGTLYGTTHGGGSEGKGTVFALDPDTGAFSTLHSFQGMEGGPNPGVTLGRDGALYGTTAYGGMYSEGSVFRVSVNGSDFSTVHHFRGATSDDPDEDDDTRPVGGVTEGPDGSLYGVTHWGSPTNEGTLYRIRLPDRTFEHLHDFGGGGIGEFPGSALTLGADGALYGDMGRHFDHNGEHNCVDIYRVTLNAPADTTPPTITSVTASPDLLTPADHQLHEVTLAVQATDDQSTEVACAITEVTSSEADSGTHPSDKPGDIVVTGDLAVELRAEDFDPVGDRVYTLHVECTDDAGNVAGRTTTVRSRKPGRGPPGRRG